MPAHRNLNNQQFDKNQMSLFDPNDPEADQASATMRKNEVMAWLYHPEGRGTTEYYPGWAKDHGVDV